MERVTLPHQQSVNVLGSQGWVSCGRSLEVELLMHSTYNGSSRGAHGGLERGLSARPSQTSS
eukprot:665832-Pyramimonas_sp.AAC.1